MKDILGSHIDLISSFLNDINISLVWKCSPESVKQWPFGPRISQSPRIFVYMFNLGNTKMLPPSKHPGQ